MRAVLLTSCCCNRHLPKVKESGFSKKEAMLSPIVAKGCSATHKRVDTMAASLSMSQPITISRMMKLYSKVHCSGADWLRQWSTLKFFGVTFQSAGALLVLLEAQL